MNTTLLIVGLAALIVNTIAGARRLRQGHLRIRSFNVVLALAACAVIAVGLVGAGVPAQIAAQGISTTDQPALSGVQANLQNGTPTPRPTSTSLPTLTPAPTETEIVLVTPITYQNADVSATATCTVTAQTTLNLRGDPSLRQRAVGRVFAGSVLPVTGRSDDKLWLRVLNNDSGITVEGWVNTQFVKVDPACDLDAIAVISADGAPSSSGVAQPTSTPRSSPTPVSATATDFVTASCTVITTTAISVRPDPSRLHTPIAQIPERTALSATAKSADGQWYRVTVSVGGSDAEGWVGAGAVLASNACANLQKVAGS